MNPQRAEIVDLLNQLGSPDDADVLESARSLHKAVTVSGWSWDELLVPDANTASAAAEPTNAPSDAVEAGDEKEIVAGEGGETNANDVAAVGAADALATDPDEDLRLVEQLVARNSLSEETKGDLKAFREDIKAGRLAEMDSRYIRALAKRLGI